MASSIFILLWSNLIYYCASMTHWSWFRMSSVYFCIFFCFCYISLTSKSMSSTSYVRSASGPPDIPADCSVKIASSYYSNFVLYGFTAAWIFSLIFSSNNFSCYTTLLLMSASISLTNYLTESMSLLMPLTSTALFCLLSFPWRAFFAMPMPPGSYSWGILLGERFSTAWPCPPGLLVAAR